MKSSLSLVSLCVILASCGGRKVDPAVKGFFTAEKESPYFQNMIAAQDFDKEGCRARIEKLVCLVEPQKEGDTGQRVCLSEQDLKPAIASLQALYDAYPEGLESVFCALGRIYLEKDFIGTAYAGTTPDGQQAVMGIRANLLLAKPVPSLQSWITWKEQLNFGGDPKDYKTRDDLVKVEASTDLQEPANDFLYYVIAHEFGHVFDFKYHANNFVCSPNSNETPCLPAEGSWSANSWTSMNRNLPENKDDPWGLLQWTPNESGQFEHRIELCFYGCNKGHGSPDLMQSIYESLQLSSFLTTYSTTNAFDDFAEGVAFYAATQNIDMQYGILLPNGNRFDLAQKFLQSPQYAAKRSWIQKFFQDHPRY